MLFLKYLSDLETERRNRAELDGKDYTPIIDKEHAWDSWAYPKANGELDDNKALTGDDLISFVDQKLSPTLQASAQIPLIYRPSSTKLVKCSRSLEASSVLAIS